MNNIFFVFLKDFKEAACDKNEAKNISLLYNLPGVAGPSGTGNGAIPKVNCAKIQKKWRENWSSWTSQGKARKFKSPQLQGCKKSSLIMRRAQNLKKCPYFFTLTVKQIGRLFFKFLWPSQNIWTLMSAYPLNLAAFEWHTFWYIYVLFLFFRILMLQKKPKI